MPQTMNLVSNGVYLIPEESDDRMGFLTTNTLTMFVLLTLISDMIPSTPRKLIEKVLLSGV